MTTPRINPNSKTCVTCYWFRAVDDESLNRSCTYIDEETGSTKIKMTRDVYDIPGERKPIVKSRCGMWKSCGMEGLGVKSVHL